jgi:hypothetical protein
VGAGVAVGAEGRCGTAAGSIGVMIRVMFGGEVAAGLWMLMFGTRGGLVVLLTTRALVARHKRDLVRIAILICRISTWTTSRLPALLWARHVRRAVGVPVLWGVLLVRHCILVVE